MRGTRQRVRPFKQKGEGTMGESHRERAACPLYTAIGMIEGRRKPMLFQRLSRGPHGFGELRRAMPGVAARVLRQQLREMQADGLVVRRTLSPLHAGVQYRLTPYGRTLGPVFDTLWRWGTRHLPRPNSNAGTLVKPPVVRAPSDPASHGLVSGQRPAAVGSDPI
jgi:DNA-binding HxlR family transcriptional regulator